VASLISVKRITFCFVLVSVEILLMGEPAHSHCTSKGQGHARHPPRGGFHFELHTRENFLSKALALTNAFDENMIHSKTDRGLKRHYPQDWIRLFMLHVTVMRDCDTNFTCVGVVAGLYV
jgi:hypothetical protein